MNANVSLTQNIYALYGRGQIEQMLSHFTPDAEWYSGGRQQDFPGLGPRKGLAQIRDFFRIVVEHMEFSEFAPDEFLADKDKVVVLGHYAMTMRENGRKMASDWVHIFTIRDGKVTKFREFFDTAQLAEVHRG